MKTLLPKFLAVTVILAMLPVLAVRTDAKPATKKTKYNVLFIASDDLRPELGAYGVKDIKTPNVDKLAARGTRFDRAYAQYPVCNPSRSSLLTGKYPTQTKVMNNNDYFRKIDPTTVTLPQYFKNNGYATLRTGKIFHGGIDDPDSWTEGGEAPDPNITERGNPNYKPKPIVNPDPDEVEAAQTQGAGIKESNSDRIIVLDGEGEKHGDYKSATRAIDYIERYKDKPFFLAVGFVKPHSPPTAPKRFFDMYDVNKIPLPVDFGTTPHALPGAPEISISPRNADLFIGRESTPELSREMKRAYWASTSFMDAQVGRVMDALEKNGLKDNTIIVFWGDHGYHLGEKGKWSKAYSLYELGLRVPLIIAMPNAKGNSTSRVVELLDLYPTLAELCGLPKPKNISGESIAKLLKTPTASFDRPAYSVTVFGKSFGRSVRTANWHYVEWDEGKSGRMLYATEEDPHELKNLSEDPKYAKTVSEMKALLAKMP
ncbi:MAG TPA: sulfatase [Pyrinomonadaceae bacterium]|nr:sulfatase [Acidobacteriota bacterium]HQZ95651.1 sulfatase [Pyrinomonadaceae bacterium]